MMKSEPSGLVLLNKPVGLTSFQALGELKRRLGTRKVGHTGTLDRFASGLLVVLTGKLTRLAPMIEAQAKSYSARAVIGVETDTLDPEGEVSQTGVPLSELPDYSEKFNSLIPRFTGEIEQIPPVYSALKINGKRASSRIRSGEKPVMKSRKIEVSRLELLAADESDSTICFEVDCGKGTYIRSLARDWASEAGSCAHLVELTRTRVGNFLLENAVSPENFITDRDLLTGKPLFQALPWISICDIDQTLSDALRVGVPLSLSDFYQPLPDGLHALFADDQFRALVEVSDNKVKYRINMGEV